jgi:hypothetical protein
MGGRKRWASEWGSTGVFGASARTGFWVVGVGKFNGKATRVERGQSQPNDLNPFFFLAGALLVLVDSC